MTVAGLLLAAGAGRRMGTPKALVELDGEPLVARALRALRDGGCTPRVVVVGAAADEAAAAARAADPDAVVVTADAWARGMGESLRAGVAAVPAGADAVLVLLVDTPGIGPDALARVAAAATRDGIVRGAYGGRPGHPVAFGRDHLAAVAAAAHDDVGARGYLAGRDDVAAVEVGDVATRHDVDTPADLADWQEG
ncbi:nucleotidyltransferase family protein [Actinomycetospora soli]|uniref:nucleotidyltransferase family protein n=1 Tax=Actinomycetospora soli TaxID=2893887 RepID=UPI001E338360|nr:NTP transferase domain-containing protein [Actinomycetospora soli]MCD2190619.1 NTP transferase domain-containing protein [Actinomycetospora soli]